MYELAGDFTNTYFNYADPTIRMVYLNTAVHTIRIVYLNTAVHTISSCMHFDLHLSSTRLK